ncbi:MAG: ribose-5-phosphate isomerase RpiA [Proteobacteria bacterium]|mgnify:CR=1 FL=1|jgi:ribose 5-phosphate isomerase A|nr:ribose-5-phosphate isomerase RpiA [Pseudomonadota bacterium]
MKNTVTDRAKYAAAAAAVDYVKDGMSVGLGTGSTAAWMIKCLGERILEHSLKIKAVPTSVSTFELATQCGISLTTLDEVGLLDLTIDGTDECDENFNMIKGGGAALLHEKVVLAASSQRIIIADSSKYVKTLGKFALPVEIIAFGWTSSKQKIECLLNELGFSNFKIDLRQKNGVILKTDENNYVLDLNLGKIIDPILLSKELNTVPGVVENGLFVKLCDLLVLGDISGGVRALHSESGKSIESVVDFGTKI